MGYLRTQTEMAKALGMSTRAMSHAVNRNPEFPPRSHFGWDEATVRMWLAEHSPTRYGHMATQGVLTPQATPTSPGRKGKAGAAPADPPSLDYTDQALLDTLRDSDSPREVARAALRLAGRAYGQAIVQGKLTKVTGDALKGSLDELRKTEKGWLDLEVASGRLIERVVAAQVAGQVALRLVRVLDNTEALLGTQVEVWMADPAWAEQPTEDRQREVRNWFRDQGRTLRETTADEIDAMLAEAAKKD